MTDKTQESGWRDADDQVRQSIAPGVKLARTLRGHTDCIGRIAWSPDGRVLASPSIDDTIRVWDRETGQCVRKLNGRHKGVSCVAFHPHGQMLASGGWDSTVKLWDVESGRLLSTLIAHRDLVTCVAFDPRGEILASGSRDRRIIFHHIGTPLTWRIFDRHRKGVSCVVFHPHGDTVASGSDAGMVRVLETDSASMIFTAEEFGARVCIVAYDPQGRMLAAGNSSGSVTLWNLDDRWHMPGALRMLEGHTAPIQNVGFLSGGAIVGSKGAEGDDTIRLWSSETGACLAVVRELTSGKWPPGLAFHPQLPLLATVGSDPGVRRMERDCVIHIWELDPAILLARPTGPTITYTSAKVVLVGESNVGKSYLAPIQA